MFGEDVSMSITSLATNKLFQVMEDAKQLSEKKGEWFYLMAENISFILKIFRPDLQMAVNFLTSRVSESDVDDWEN